MGFKPNYKYFEIFLLFEVIVWSNRCRINLRILCFHRLIKQLGVIWQTFLHIKRKDKKHWVLILILKTHTILKSIVQNLSV